MAHRNLRSFIKKLEEAGQIAVCHEEVDPHFEIAEIHRRVAAADGPALFFPRVKGSKFPVVTNLFGSLERVHMAFDNRPEDVIAKAVHLATRDFPPTLSKLWKERSTIRSLMRVGLKNKRSGPVFECTQKSPKLTELPLLTSWPEDGGPFITLPLVYTQSTETGLGNLGMYRIQRYDDTTTGLHFQIGKGCGYHLHEAEGKGLDLPVHIYLGGPPALILGAITPLPENVPELLLASLLQDEKLQVSRTPYGYPIPIECEFALVGRAKAGKRRLEGPFGDHYGFYSHAHDFPVFDCEAIHHRKDAIYPATVVGKPRQEDYYIGNYLQELLAPLFPVVMPGVLDLWSYGETGFHALACARVKERYYRESMSSAFRILGEGQLSLTKFLLLTDQPVNVRDIRAVLTSILERFCPETDLFIFANLSLDTLDYTGPALNKGSRGVMLGLGPKRRELQASFSGELPLGTQAKAFCPGCLLLTASCPIDLLLTAPSLAHWPLVILVDSIEKSSKDEASFLWSVFMRFEPAADIHAKSCIVRNQISYSGPILIDARQKPSYPKEVLVDEATAELVSRRQHAYFKGTVPMAPSEAAHVV